MSKAPKGYYFIGKTLFPEATTPATRKFRPTKYSITNDELSKLIDEYRNHEHRSDCYTDGFWNGFRLGELSAYKKFKDPTAKGSEGTK